MVIYLIDKIMRSDGPCSKNIGGNTSHRRHS